MPGCAASIKTNEQQIQTPIIEMHMKEERILKITSHQEVVCSTLPAAKRNLFLLKWLESIIRGHILGKNEGGQSFEGP